MSRRGENIFKRRDGRWEARYVKGRKLSGGIQYGFCYGKSYREARDKAMQCKAALMNNMPLPEPNSRHRFAFYCGEWMRQKRENVKESSYYKYEVILNKHILPFLGERAPQEISTQLAEQFKRELLRQGLSVKSVRDILVVLRSVLKYGAAQFPGVFPAVEIQYPREVRKEARVLSVEEQKRFVSCLRKDMDECGFGIFLALRTGLRIGEVCALRWENISMRDRTVHVCGTMQRLRVLDDPAGNRTRVVVSTPKSAAAMRTIPLTDSMFHLCELFDPGHPDAFVLTGTEKFMEPRQLQKRLAKLTRECGLDGVHFHTLRHTFATRCVEAGFEIKSLSEILGHADTSVTLGRYVHSSMELKRANMEKLETINS